MDFRGQPEIVREYGLSGTEPVINQECMLVHEKSGRFVNLSGTAIIRVNYYRLKPMVWGVFLRVVEIAGIFRITRYCASANRWLVLKTQILRRLSHLSHAGSAMIFSPNSKRNL